MGLARPKILYTPEEYLEMERKSEVRREFFDGEIYPLDDTLHAMAGESLAHSRICVNLIGEVGTLIATQDCRRLPLLGVLAASVPTLAKPHKCVPNRRFAATSRNE